MARLTLDSKFVMCDTIGCPLRLSCRRFMAAPVFGQAWGSWVAKDGKCAGLIPLKEIKNGKQNIPSR